MLRDLERATFSNIEEQSLNYVIFTLQPWITKWNAEYKRKLVRQETKKLYFFQHNPRHALGDELVCLCELEAANLRSFALKAFREGMAGG